MGYGAYQFTVFLGVLAQQMFSVAMAWMIYERTGSPLHLGYVGLAQFLPALLFAPIAGHLADRFSRSRLFLICLTGGGLTSLACGIFFYGFPREVWPFYFLLIGTGLLRALEAPSASALLPQLVSEIELPSAVAWISSTKQVANVLGPAVGGIAFVSFGGGNVFIASAAFAFLGAAMMTKVPAVLPQKAIASFNWKNVAAGARYIRNEKILLGALSLDLFAVLFGGAVALLPVYAKDILLLGPAGLGWLKSAPALGSLLMAVILARFPMNNHIGKKLFFAVGTFGLVTIVLALSRNLWLTGLVLVLSGASNVVSVIIRQTLLQLHTPDEMRGRVSAVNQVFNLSSNQLGEFESGLTASWWGPVGSVLFGGIGTCLVAGLWAWHFPELLRLKSFGRRHEL